MSISDQDISSMYPNVMSPVIVKRAPYVNLLTSYTVDDEVWYTVSLLRDASVWLRETYADHEDRQWYTHTDDRWQTYFNVFDIHEKVYTMLMLRWSN